MCYETIRLQMPQRQPGTEKKIATSKNAQRTFSSDITQRRWQIRLQYTKHPSDKIRIARQTVVK